jgi:hypothetical protein
MKSTKIINFKETLKNSMIENFKKDGCLTPILFFLEDNVPVINQIPSYLLSSQEGKHVLGNIMRRLCQEPNVFAAGIIMEAWGAKLDKDDEISKSLMNGDIRVRDLDNKQDIIMMIFSTPEGEEAISYIVDCKNKTIGEPFTGEEMDNMAGNFANFFNWTKN